MSYRKPFFILILKYFDYTKVMKNNDRYLIVFDLDGTLLNDTEKKIMPKTKEYILKLASLGHVISLASGRPPRAVIEYYNELCLHSPMITYNGACISDPKDPSIQPIKYFFPYQAILDFMNQFEEGDIVDAFAENDDTIYLLRENEEFAKMFHREGLKIVYGDFRKTMKEDVYAAVFQYKDEKTRNKSFNVKMSDSDFFIRGWYDVGDVSEFGNRKISKASGVKHVQKIYGISDDHVIAFGDAENDFEMLTAASHPFAMKNGSKVLIDLVKHVSVEDNNHEGIYLTLRQFFEGK